jgi:hypothetical protein
MAEQPEIDPRYDPAFQRGYDGTATAGSRSDATTRHAGPRVTSALQRPLPLASAAGRGASAPAQTVGLPPGAPAAPAAPGAPEADAAPAASAAPVVQVAAPALRPPWTNPFAILVTIIGIGVLGVGIWLLQETFQMTESEAGFQSQTDYWFLQWGMTASPILVSLGIAILVTVLVMCAAYWGRRPDPAPPLDE